MVNSQKREETMIREVNDFTQEMMKANEFSISNYVDVIAFLKLSLEGNNGEGKPIRYKENEWAELTQKFKMFYTVYERRKILSLINEFLRDTLERKEMTYQETMVCVIILKMLASNRPVSSKKNSIKIDTCVAIVENLWYFVKEKDWPSFICAAKDLDIMMEKQV